MMMMMMMMMCHRLYVVATVQNYFCLIFNCGIVVHLLQLKYYCSRMEIVRNVLSKYLSIVVHSAQKNTVSRFCQ